MSAPGTAASRRGTAVLAALLLVAGFLGLLAPRSARADSAPPATSSTPATVAADALPTVQINGVAWQQVVVGTTVYVAGSFTSARPAGAAAGTGETPRGNLLAYDITTGTLLTSWAPTLNAQALTIAASPDGSRIYVGGDFTQANGQPRQRVAAFDATTGALVAAWHPTVNSQVRAIAATADTVYLGGSITAVGGVSRSRLAAVRASDGGLLPWAPVPGVGSTAGNRDGNTATSDQVLGLVVTSGGTQVVASGRFDSLNGVKSTGIGALDATTGATRPFAVNQLITNQGVNSAIYSLTTDGTTVYGTGYDYQGPGNVEGSFAAVADGGALIEINDCRGDTYSSYATRGVLYVASHTHQCTYIGGFPEQNPRVNKHGTAYTATPSNVVRWGTNVNWVGKPAGTQLDFFPDFSIGAYTGQNQATWSVTGNGDYVVYGGEFPRVNGTGQQGLVRFAVPTIAPDKIGPVFTGFTTTVATPSPGVARVAWKSTYDNDNEYLTYRVFRDSTSTAPVYTTTAPSTWWSTPMMGWSDTGQTGSHRYKVTATDPFGNSTASPWSATVTIPTGTTPARTYAAAVRADGATDHYALDEVTGTTVYSDLGGTDLTAGAGVTRGATGAIAGDPDTASSFAGSSTAFAASPTAIAAPNVFTLEAWFRTTSTTGGRIVGYGDASTGTSTTTDRHVYMDAAGRVLFGVNWLNTRRTLQSAAGLNDGRYHHVVASMGPAGMALYVDGRLVGSRADTTSGPNYTAYFRIGADASWSGANAFNGTIDEVAVYPTVLSAGQVTNHWTLGSTGTATNVPPTASFTSTAQDLALGLDGSGSTDADGSIASYAWAFGDGGTATGATAAHTYAAGGTYQVTLTVTDDKGATGTQTRAVTVTPPPPNQPPTAAFTATPNALAVTVDGGGSTDADGSIASYAWAFGDGGTATGATAAHTYAAGGTYTVTLTVTDDDGATGSVSHDVTAVPGPQLLAADTFARTVAAGFGTADTGGAWTTVNGGTRTSVTLGAGVLRLDAAGNLDNAFLQGVSSTGSNVLVSFSASSTPTGSGTYVYVTGRRLGSNQEYRVRVRLLADGTVALAFSRLADGAAEAFPGGELIVPGLTYTPGTTLDVRLQTTGTGTTTLRATVWTHGTTEPATPTLTRTDATASLQAAGGLGLAASLPGSATAATTVRITAYTASTAG
ncbi:PKD domain-containing protein [Petropleomorpha daqingensis]|uniref:PKD repeat protein n=1 Tax=Petropleomorpha daqingensis TaxID=2026353 RepID=A0A853CGB6_9ACTN|nr:PKD domain-containing protein [Petropleomorpha daqingensis]NYJ06256.1 PKD repeat protein [Petropleomorpha daqingensis]